ncbi:MAG: hypothetical protein IAE97_08815 [Chthoniobacterales bacterium]|nr:hypothetical protein [Chthoniobacterales bacterium]
MRFRRTSPHAWELDDMHPLFAGLLAELPEVAAAHDRASGRLYPDPVGKDGPSEMRADWGEHVRPELECLFASNREIVARDLAPLADGDCSGRLIIPADHLDAWLNVLNQARLITVEANGLDEADLDNREFPDLATHRGMALLRTHFYAHLQELMVEAVS